MSKSDRLRAAACAGVFCCVLAACGESDEAFRAAGLTALTEWLEQAAAGARDDELCHAFGLLKHPEATCADMLEHASRIVPEERTVVSTRRRDCIETVCGDFFEVELESVDEAGREVTEIAALKRDDGRFRVYWYRTNSLLSEIEKRTSDVGGGPDEADDARYTELVNRYPALYQYPPCRDVRVSSSNIVGDLVAPDAIDEGFFQRGAASCEADFCLAFVGRKIAAVCPR